MSLAEEINRIALGNGFEDTQSFAISFVMQGLGITDFVDYLADEYKLYYSYSAVYGTIRHLVPDRIFALRYIFRLNVKAKKLGYDSVEEMLEGFRSMPKISIAKTLGCDMIHAGRFIEKSGIKKSTAKRAFAPLKEYERGKDGFKSLGSMLKWEKQAKALGFETVKQAFDELSKAEELTETQIAGLFCVSRTALWVRKKGMRHG